jgi:hypothetical protein
MGRGRVGSQCGVAESDASPVYLLECRHSTVCLGCGQNMVKVRSSPSATHSPGEGLKAVQGAPPRTP